jgi:hypothetical protein
MNDEERSALLHQLRTGQAAISAELSGVTDAQAHFRPEQGAWSILECVEHVALAESAMLVIISRKSTPGERDGNREDAYLKNSVNRGRKFQAPELMHPRDRYSSLDAALEAFAERRARTIRYIETVEDDLRHRLTTHPVAGEITCRECLALLIGHPLRHIEQIREIKASPNYPR